MRRESACLAGLRRFSYLHNVVYAGLLQNFPDIKLSEGLNIHDVNIRYTKDRNVITLYGRSPEEADSFVRRITEEGTEAAVEMLCV